MKIQSWHQSDYNQDYTPPAPVLAIQIAGPEAGDWQTVRFAFVDSGADTSIVPRDLLIRIAAAEWDQAWLRSQWGESRLVYRYEIDLMIADRVFPSVLVVEDDMGDEVILGRDFINRLRLLLDGPAGTASLLE
ncbi:MAG: hypothetical protein D6790_02635 [Caldilineae bacterium]|nr:MAG: hypothetical protein D6790_02635 [Caldilineae bacterium]